MTVRAAYEGESTPERRFGVEGLQQPPGPLQPILPSLD